MFCFPTLVDAHAYPVQMTPSQDERFESPPEQIKMTFSEPINLNFSEILVETKAGVVIEAEQTIENNETLILTVPKLDAGTYLVHWKVLALDSHITEGSYTFIVEAEPVLEDPAIEHEKEEPTLPVERIEPADEPHSHHSDSETEEAVVEVSQTPHHHLTLLTNIQTLTIILVAGMYFFIHFIIGTKTPNLLRKPFTKKTELRIYVYGAIILFGTGVTQLYIHSLLLTSNPVWSDIGILSTSTLSGAVLLIQPLLLLLLMILVSYHKQKWTAILVLAALILTLSLTGHALTAYMVISHFVHVTLTIVWVGGLLGFVIYSFFLQNSIKKIRFIHQRLLLFSQIAFVSVGLLMVTGLVMSLTFLTSWESLFHSLYGQLLIGKISLFFVILAIASFHRFVWLPSLNQTETAIKNGKSSLRKLILWLRIELVLLLAVVLVAGILSTTSPPEDIQPPSENPSESHHNH